MRSLVELLIILRREVKRNLISGLCGAVNSTDEFGRPIFTKEERELLKLYIYKHRPDNIDHDYYLYRGYWWESGLVKPRLKWIDEQIKLLS